MRLLACALVALAAPLACIVVHDSILGSPCNTDSDCGSAFCVDGTCSLTNPHPSDDAGVRSGEGEGASSEGEGASGEGEGASSDGEGASSEGEGSSAGEGEGEGEGEGSSAEGEGEGSVVLRRSCAEILANGEAVGDGFYDIDPGSGPISVFCDMTQDGGGFMRVTPAMVLDEGQRVTVDLVDNGEGLIATAYINAFGCGQDMPRSVDLLLIDDVIPWTQVRYHEEFHGHESCWEIFGDVSLEQSHDANLIAFDPMFDVIRDQVAMGGGNGDAFDGTSALCNTDAANFWFENASIAAATVLQRRNDPMAPAGLRTEGDCGDFGSGTSSAGFVVYRDVFVR